MHGRILFDLVLIAAGVAGAVEARAMTGFGPLGPGDFPAATMGLGSVLMIAILTQDLAALRRTARAPGARTSSPPGPEACGRGGIGAAAMVGLLSLFILLLAPLGFLPAATGFLFLAALLCDWIEGAEHQTGHGPRVLRAAVFAPLAAGLSWAVFTHGFGLIFP